MRASQRCVRRKGACVAKVRASQKSSTSSAMGGGREQDNETARNQKALCAGALRQAPRRSASQVPEHSPPVQEPAPAVPESRPEPVALLLPALTVTVTWPLLATLPLMVAGLEPSASMAPLRMR